MKRTSLKIASILPAGLITASLAACANENTTDATPAATADTATAYFSEQQPQAGAARTATAVRSVCTPRNRPSTAA